MPEHELSWNEVALGKLFIKLWAHDHVALAAQEESTSSAIRIYHKERWQQDLDNRIMKAKWYQTLCDHFMSFYQCMCDRIKDLRLEREKLDKEEDKEKLDAEIIEQESPRREAQKLIDTLGKSRNVNAAVDCVLNLLASSLEPIVFDVGPEQWYNVHFNDCVFDVRAKAARPRLKADYVTEILEYPYIPRDQVCEKATEEIVSFFTNIQPDLEQRTFTLAFLAYS